MSRRLWRRGLEGVDAVAGGAGRVGDLADEGVALGEELLEGGPAGELIVAVGVAGVVAEGGAGPGVGAEDEDLGWVEGDVVEELCLEGVCDGVGVLGE